MSFGFDRRDWKNPENSSSEEEHDNSSNQELVKEKLFFSKHLQQRQEALALYDDLRQYVYRESVPELMESLTPGAFLNFFGLE